mmetsp:Transcript_12770/g.19800  ORF Transcript_12770/g.19800 Transcript_12770/m.19800 type:complete len:138 (-) Transcript_12770:331-744(-)
MRLEEIIVGDCWFRNLSIPAKEGGVSFSRPAAMTALSTPFLALLIRGVQDIKVARSGRFFLKRGWWKQSIPVPEVRRTNPQRLSFRTKEEYFDSFKKTFLRTFSENMTGFTTTKDLPSGNHATASSFGFVIMDFINF